MSCDYLTIDICECNNIIINNINCADTASCKRLNGVSTHTADTKNGYESATDGSWDKIKSSGKIIIGYTVFAPIAFGEGENFTGYDIELARAVKYYLNETYSLSLELEFQKISWASKEVLIENGTIDLEKTPTVILVIGVNGVGKTTSIGKIATLLKSKGKKVVLAAADTFRAAAIEQLGVWADRAGVPMVKQGEGADPAAVVFDAIASFRKQNAEFLIVDTAGRLHNKKNLLDELAKINRVIDRELPGANRETLLVLDAVTGQNGLSQAKEFTSAANITGIVLTKLDGTAKGGIVLAIKEELGIPVKLIGVGEGADDLQPFNGNEFVKAMFESNGEVAEE